MNHSSTNCTDCAVAQLWKIRKAKNLFLLWLACHLLHVVAHAQWAMRIFYKNVHATLLTWLLLDWWAARQQHAWAWHKIASISSAVSRRCNFCSNMWRPTVLFSRGFNFVFFFCYFCHFNWQPQLQCHEVAKAVSQQRSLWLWMRLTVKCINATLLQPKFNSLLLSSLRKQVQQPQQWHCITFKK